MQHVAIENLFLLDIETVCQAEDFKLLNDEWQELWSEKTLKSLPMETSTEEHYTRRAAIYAEFAKVICISTGYFRKEGNEWQLRIKSFYAEDEKQVLESFAKMLGQVYTRNSKWVFTGHNIKEFDIPFLCRRMIVNNIEIPFSIDFQNMRPWETPTLDTLHLWRFGDYKHYISLKLLAATLNVPSPKTDIDGSQVGEVFWKEKNLPRIVNYCQKDVATVGNIILRFKNLPLLKDEQVIVV